MPHSCKSNIFKVKKDIIILFFIFNTIFLFLWPHFTKAEDEVKGFNQLPLEVQKRLNEAKYQVRIKDVVNIEGVRDNILMGYGLVVGLDGTGDNLRNSTFTQQELESFLGRLGINTKGANIKTKNTAAVTVTATLPPFMHAGTRINVTVSTLGDAKSINGGVLLATPLLGADGQIYAVAQGNIIIPHKDSSSESSKGKTIPTTGYITNGAIIEKEIDFSLNEMRELRLGLNSPDISTANTISDVINTTIPGIAIALDPATVKITVPKKYLNNVIGLLNKVENLMITTSSAAKVIIDSRTGVITFSENVKIDTVAITHGNLIAQIAGQSQSTEPNTNSPILEKNATLQDLVQGLNSLGVEPRELAEILQNLKDMGALKAEIIIRN